MMTVLVPPGRAVAGCVLALDPGEVHHLRVRRAGEAVGVSLRDGEGLIGTGVFRGDGAAGELVVEQVERAPRPLPMRLGVAAGDRERFAWLVEKAAELGVTDLFLLETARTAGVASRVRDDHVGRLRRRAVETLKQCGAAWAPAVHPPEPLAAFLGRALDGARWLADADGAPVPPEFGLGPLTVVVGPEGGFTGEEAAAAHAAGYRRVRLAAHTLRFETAALAAAAHAAAARVGGPHGGSHE